MSKALNGGGGMIGINMSSTRRGREEGEMDSERGGGGDREGGGGNRNS